VGRLASHAHAMILFINNFMAIASRLTLNLALF
jgi:hypothetical protein